MPEGWRIKLCLLGDSGVGKTSLIRRFVLDQFDDSYIATLGAKVSKKKISLKSAKGGKGGKEVVVTLFIFDIMGSHSLRELLLESYFSGVDGVLAVCDLTHRETIDGLKDWVKAVERVAGRVPMAVLGNKVDLISDPKASQEVVEAVAADFQCPAFLTSAKTGENVEEAMKGVVVAVIKKAAAVRSGSEVEAAA
jgi:small GTP-binding protein